MAQPATTAKLEERRFKLKTDPKSRLFYQLAEELRKAGHFDESEHVLRTGLVTYPTYLAAWVSLGRTLREQKNDAGAVEALNRALQLDPGNVVAARILADAYLALGEKVEAIKKYKLVHALLPSDEELRTSIERLERELDPSSHEPIAETVETPMPSASAPFPIDEIPNIDASPDVEASTSIEPALNFDAAPNLEAEAEPEPEAVPAPFEEDSPFDRTMPPFAEAAQSLEEEARVEEATADVEPMSVAHDESPFEEPIGGFSSDAFEVEAPAGMHIESAPMVAEVAAPVFDTEEDAPEVSNEDATYTVTMADLYVGQGLVEDARHIYEHILARDPGNAEVRGKLDAIAPRVNPKVAALERWLGKVSKREVGRV
jgi:tetratricopeptide (TPR) repeat protein